VGRDPDGLAWSKEKRLGRLLEEAFGNEDVLNKLPRYVRTTSAAPATESDGADPCQSPLILAFRLVIDDNLISGCMPALN
jgi:hypothetical protein